MNNSSTIERPETLSTAIVETVPGVLPHHLRHLEQSGLTPQTIRTAGIRSETSPDRLAAMLGWRKPSKGIAPAIVIPFNGGDGTSGYCRIRPDTPRKIKGKPVKYESPRGQPNRPYYPPGVAEAFDHADTELLFTEGEKKALAAMQAGFPCVGLIGVWGWKESRHERMLPELERIKWNGRQVRIVFDSDLERKPDVQLAESRLAKALTDRGAIVRCVRLPDGPPDENGEPSKMGLDDFLVARGPVELRKLLDAAIEPEPVSVAEGKEDASKIDPGEEAKAYLATLHHEGLPRLRFWRGSWWGWQRGAYHEREQNEVRADLIRKLDASYRNLGSGIVSCVLDHVRAHAILPGTTEPGQWIAEPPAAWKPDDILATRKTLIHLPTLVAGGVGMMPATPKLFSTAALDFDFDMSAPRPDNWLAFLNQLWPGDAASIETLQQWIGYLLTPDTRQQKILLLVGPKRSGKGTIARIIRELVGRDNVAGPTLASLATNFGLSSLLGKSTAIISDARLSGRTDSAVVIERLLAISGEDALDVDRKYREAITCKLSTRLMILTNELPRLSDSSGALAGRFIVLQLRHSFFGREDHHLTDKLLPELPGILLWAIDGWRRLRERGRLVQPDSGRELAGELEDITSPIGVFLRERCVLGAEFSIAVDDLYAAWKTWTESKGWKKPGTEQTFGRDLRTALPGITTQNRRDGVGGRYRQYVGIGLIG